jgi:hypothetical protein
MGHDFSHPARQAQRRKHTTGQDTSHPPRRLTLGPTSPPLPTLPTDLNSPSYPPAGTDHTAHAERDFLQPLPSHGAGGGCWY